MRAVTPGDLNDILDADLVWRRREITSIVNLAQRVSSADQAALIRAGIPMLYAHWEGFGRSCILRYLEHVSYKSIKFKDLRPSFLYLASIGSLSQIGKSASAHEIDLFTAIMLRAEAKNKDDFRKRISTKSNLRSGVLRELLCACGLNEEHFISDESFIDTELCDARNEIAHGAGGGPTLKIFQSRRNRTFAIMTALQGLVVNAALNADYKVAA